VTLVKLEAPAPSKESRASPADAGTRAAARRGERAAAPPAPMRTAIVICVAVLASGACTYATEPASAAKRPPAKKVVKLRPGTNIVAEARWKRVPVFARPRGRKAIRSFRHPVVRGVPLVFLVQWKQRRWTWPKWVRVQLPSRPNGATGWIRSRSVRFLKNPYRIRVNLRHKTISVWRRKNRILLAKVGVGRAVTPTPTGRYYLVQLIKSRKPRGIYGPYAFGTSAYSTVYTRFGRGNGQVGLHGTNRPRRLGKNVSHGCIRVHNKVIRRLARYIPLGTPLMIVRAKAKEKPLKPAKPKASKRPKPRKKRPRPR
jgi:lipoprotein-anchoring transpeptidase ErfK/SrfK